MAKRKTTVGLIAFLKCSSKPADRMPGCANFDHHYGGCLFRTAEGTPSDDLLEEEKSKCPCSVEDGQRCAYFEKAVLPTAADIGLKEHVYKLYAKHVGIEWDCEIACGDIRRCPDCGAELKAHQKYCDDCSKRRRQDSYRKAREKQRSKRNSL